MALALNVYQTVTGIASTAETVAYMAPIGYSGIVLLAQVSNIGSNTQSVTLKHQRTVGITTVDTEVLLDYPLPINDSSSLIQGKLVLETSDSLVISASSDTDVKYIISILETLNQ